MASDAKYQVLPVCPICIETLTPPVRMLLCGHNMCHKCLEELCDSKHKNCPTCRKEIELGSRGADDVPRNRGVEHMIELFTSMERRRDASTKLQNELTRNELKKLADSASSCMAEKNFKEALSELDALLCQSRGISTVRPTINKIKCLLELNRIDEAVEITILMTSKNDTPKHSKKWKQEFENCRNNIFELAELFSQYHYETTIALSDFLFSLVLQQRNERKVDQLLRIGVVIMKAALHLTTDNKCQEIKEQYSFMETILDELYNIDDFDMKMKAKDIVSFLNYFSMVCYEARDYTKSIINSKQGIAIMKTVFSRTSCKYKIFAMCYYNLAIANEKVNQLEEAKNALSTAIETCSEATDWDNDAEQISICKPAESLLSEIEVKLTRTD